MSISSRIVELNAQGRPVPRDIPPELAIMPSGVFIHDIATAQRLDQEHEAEEAQRRQEALERVQAADEAAYTSSIYVRTEPYRDGPVPTAAALAVDVEGLSAARSELVRCSAWLDQAQAELARLEASREAFITQLGAPVITKAALDKLVAADKSGFLAWLKAGSDEKTRPSVDAFRRKQIEERLERDCYESEIARSGLHELETELAVLRQGIAEIEKRRPRLAQAVVVEEAAPTMADYAAAAEHLRALATQLAGLVRAAPNQGLNRGLPIKQIEIPLLALGSKTSKIVVSDAEIARAAAPWRERERQLLADPMADVTLPGAN